MRRETPHEFLHDIVNDGFLLSEELAAISGLVAWRDEWAPTLHRQGSEDRTEGEETAYRMATDEALRIVAEAYGWRP